ncbi:MAG: V-type ATPase subunit [Methanobacteriota archaeon]
MFEWILDPNSIPFWLLIIALILGAAAILARPLFTYMKFVYPNAKFEAMGNPYIHEKELIGLLEQKDLTSFIETVNASKNYIIIGEDITAIQKSFDTHLLQTVTMMKNDSSKKLNTFYDLYLEKIDISLIKKTLKSILLGEKHEIDPTKALHPNTKALLERLRDVSKENLPKILSDHGFDSTVIEALSVNDLDLLVIDTELDKAFLNKLTHVRVPYKCEQAKQRYVQQMIDILNIKHLIRAKHLGYDTETCKKIFLGPGQHIAPWKYQQMAEAEQIPQIITLLEGTVYFSALNTALEQYTKNTSVQYFETALDSLFLRLIRDISHQNYATFGPTLRFLVSKEFEIQNLKVITKSLAELLPVEFTKHYIVLEAD